MKGKKLTLNRPLVVLDIETTGLSRETDRIVEISIIKMPIDGKPFQKSRLINPGREIPPHVSKIHGITDKDVAKAPRFEQIAPSLADLIRGCDIAGFNSNYFDVPFLLYEFERCGIFNAFDECEFVDVSNIYRYFNPRTLEAAYADYCGKKFTAHKAEEDTRATAELLEAIYNEHLDELPEGIESLKSISAKVKALDILGVIIEGDNGPEFAIGKNKGRLVTDCPDYCDWIVNKSTFTMNTKAVVKRILSAKAVKPS